MLTVDVFSGGILIGRADLLACDPPMGVASGRMRTAPDYDRLQPRIAVAAAAGTWDALRLEIRTEQGRAIAAAGGIEIVGCLEEAEPPEIIVAGIDCANGDFAAWFGTDPGYRAYYGM